MKLSETKVDMFSYQNVSPFFSTLRNYFFMAKSVSKVLKKLYFEYKPLLKLSPVSNRKTATLFNFNHLSLHRRNRIRKNSADGVQIAFLKRVLLVAN